MQTMKGNVAKYLLFDACFWIALLDDRDTYHRMAVDLYNKTEDWHGLLPWPTLYEVLSTRLSRNHQRVRIFSDELHSPGIKLIDDTPYRPKALLKTVDLEYSVRTLSLVDLVIRDMLADINLRMDGFVTFNHRDFNDVCSRRRLPMYPKDLEE